MVFLIKIVHHDRPWFCSGLHHVAYVPAATHVRTTDAGKVVELSVTRHHTGSLVWLMRKFSVWNFFLQLEVCVLNLVTCVGAMAAKRPLPSSGRSMHVVP